MYKFNEEKLVFYKTNSRISNKILRVIGITAITLLVAVIINLFYTLKFDTPYEKGLRKENEALNQEFNKLYDKFTQASLVLEDVKQRDLNIYQTIFETAPISEQMSEAGWARIGKLNNLEELNNSLIVNISKEKLHMLFEDMAKLSHQYDHVASDISKGEVDISSIPSIIPLPKKYFKGVAAGWGYKIHPIYKIKKFHYGQDFTAPIGEKVIATADGVVKKINWNPYMKHGKSITIDHENGYETYYSHLQSYNVYKGKKIKKGEVIGFVGNTGRSTAPHLHYEVHVNGKPVNPVYYCFGGLTPREFDRLTAIASRSNQTFD